MQVRSAIEKGESYGHDCCMSNTGTSTLHAALFAMGGMSMLGFIDNFVARMAQDIGVWQFHGVRSVLVLAVLVPLALWMGWDVKPKRFWAIVVRSFLTSTAMILYFGSLAALPIAEVAAGLFTSPIWVLILSWVLLKQRIGPVRILAVAIGFTGVLMILRPDAAGMSLASLVPLAAGLFWACGALATRTICEQEGASALLVGFFAGLGVWGLAGLGYFAALGIETEPVRDGFFGTGWQPFTRYATIVLLAQSVLGMVGVGMLTRAYQLTEASHVAVFEYAFLVSAGFWAYMLFGDVPDPLALIGIGLIAVAGMLIVLRSVPQAGAEPT